MQPDLIRLRELLRDDPYLPALFTLLRRVRVRANVTSVKNLVKTSTGYRGASRDTSDRLLQSFRLLESCGFGRLHDHTRRDRARFEWAIHPGIVADLASQPGAIFQPHHLLLSEATLPAAPGTEPADPAGRQRHTFPLRPDAEATLLLPADLTAGEARRLGHYLLSLARH